MHERAVSRALYRLLQDRSIIFLYIEGLNPLPAYIHWQRVFRLAQWQAFSP